MKFPNEIYVAIRNPKSPSKDQYLDAAKTKAGVIEEDGPTFVATYRLEIVEQLSKVVQPVKK